MVTDLQSLADNISCSDCNAELHVTGNWEPIARVDISSGDIVHLRICGNCIEDIENVREANHVRLAIKLARRAIRRERHNAH